MKANENETQERLALDAKAAAKLLGVSRRTVQRWAAAGQIPHKKMGKLLLFSPRALKDWLDKSGTMSVDTLC